jgi:hypothetical protein
VSSSRHYMAIPIPGVSQGSKDATLGALAKTVQQVITDKQTDDANAPKAAAAATNSAVAAAIAYFQSLPTSSPGGTGNLWWNAGVLNIT